MRKDASHHISFHIPSVPLRYLSYMRRPHCFSIISKFLLSFYKGHSTRTSVSKQLLKRLPQCRTGTWVESLSINAYRKGQR